MKPLFLAFVFLLLVPFAVADDVCQTFCIENNYTYGACRATVEEGFCEGITTETVYSFSQCTNYERCCCGYGVAPDANETVVNETAEETVVADTEESEPSTIVQVPVAETLFWFLLILVGLLAVAYWTKKGKKEEFIPGVPL